MTPILAIGLIGSKYSETFNDGSMIGRVVDSFALRSKNAFWFSINGTYESDRYQLPLGER